LKSRRLGKSGLEISEVGLGCWQLGGDFGPIADDRARDVLQAAANTGIDFWDTADVYGNGESERRIGRYASHHAANPVLASKVGRAPDLYPDGYSKEKVRKNIEASADRLSVDCIDLVQLHCVPPDVLKAGDLLAWMEDFQQQGLIRSFGASVETIEEGLFAATHPALTSLQIIFNLFRQDAITKLFPLAVANDVGIIVRLPLASGVLSGNMVHGQQFDASDHRQYNRNGEMFSQGETFSGIPFDIAVDFVDVIKSWAPDGMSMAQLAMRWILDQPAVTTVIAGASRPEQVIENASVSQLSPLDSDLHHRLAEFYQQKVAAEIRVLI
jgi:aryl-alcohol dehydrogenase-like predicted oxidoreductase